MTGQRDIDDGGSAFPFSTIDNFTAYGMSLRDWFAGMALQGLCAQSIYAGDRVARAYEFADGMLKARQK
jgi:hypothetical protein